MSNSFIPVIDVSALYSEESAARSEVVARIGAACKDVGFFYVVNHRVAPETISLAVDKVAQFFALPLEQRMAYKADRNNRGYRDVSDTMGPNGKRYSRDVFDIGFPYAATDDEVLRCVPFYAPNQWPDIDGFEERVADFYAGSYELSLKLMEAFALHFGQQADFFTRHFSRPVADMSLNHYCPYEEALEMGASETASGAHTDNGVITVLWQDSVGGLEILDSRRNWIPAPPIPGSFVINLGELMKRWTNGRFQATVHRVIHRQNSHRYSIPLFCNPNFDTCVDPRELGTLEADALYAPVTSGEFLISRFKRNRKTWGAAESSVVEYAY